MRDPKEQNYESSSWDENWDENGPPKENEADHPHAARGAIIEDPVSDRPCESLRHCLKKFEETWPRSYSLLVKVLIPILLLIGLSFLGGYLIVLVESGEEMDRNDAAIANFVDVAVHFSLFADKNGNVADNMKELEDVVDVPEICSLTLNVTTFDREGLLIDLVKCTLLFLERKELGSLSFAWVTCGEDVELYSQSENVITQWVESYISHWGNIYSPFDFNTNVTFDEAIHKEALSTATGSEDCSGHVSGGAIFWFTVMTTIGYGNTSPVTDAGRTLVYTLGFASILCFTSLISRAGTICLAVFDDFALRIGAKRLVRGVWAALFWLIMLVLWLLILVATVQHAHQEKNLPEERSFRDMFWFAYITIVTVGFGDYHIPHETTKPGDLFYIPILCLIGFVLLANFLHKYSAALRSLFPKGPSLDEVLEERRKKRK